MDSINLKYLRFDLIFATNQSLYAKINLQENQLRGSNLEIEKYKEDNSHLRNIIKIDSATAKKDIQILENEKLYYKQKSKGKPLVFLAGFSIGTIAVFLLKLL